MKRSVLLVLFIALAIASLSAVPITASWIDGKVERQVGSTWVVLSLGDKLDSGDTIRLAPDASAEFLGGKQKVALSAAGVFPLEGLFKGGADATKKRTGAVNTLARFVDPTRAPNSTAVGGVRGAAVEPEATALTWATESEDVRPILEDARALARDGKYTEAALRFQDAIAIASGDEKDAAVYGKAWALAADGSTLQAVKALRSMPSSGPWAGPRAILLARLDLETGAKDEAKTLLSSAIDARMLAGDDLVLAKSMLDEASN